MSTSQNKPILELDLTVYHNLSILDIFGYFKLDVFSVLEAVRTNNEKAFDIIVDTLNPNTEMFFIDLQDLELIKIIKKPENDESWWDCIDLRNKYLDLFPKKTSSDVEEWIEEWRNKFPSGIRSGGYPVRGDKQGCLSKMKAFINKYKYSKDVIMRATDRYIQSKEKENWAYMKLAHYFILKDNQSSLATYCEEITNNVTEEKDDWTTIPI